VQLSGRSSTSLSKHYKDRRADASTTTLPI
jgi:hypothetical protein